MSQLISIAGELATLCSGFASAEVRFVPDYQLGETDFASKIYVVPNGSGRSIDTRADSVTEYMFEIGLLRWVTSESDIQANVATLESIAEALLGEELSGSYVSKVDTKLLYSVEAVAKRKQYVGVLAVTVRDLS